MNLRLLLCTAGLALAACTTPAPEEAPVDLESVPLKPAPGTMKRLSAQQYANTVRDLFGADIVVPHALEPDQAVEGLISIGSAMTTISPLGVERYEAGALQLARQAFDNEERRARVMTCSPGSAADEACYREIARDFGRKAWRRPLSDTELTRLVSLGVQAGTQYNDFDKGAEFLLTALLQSPNFLFRIELGEPDPDRPRRFRLSDYEMATRLAYFLTNSTPDDELLDAAENGELTTHDGLHAQVNRLVESPKAREAVRGFFTELYQLSQLDDLQKDTTVFTFMDKELGPAAREETLLLLEDIIFERNGDFRTFFTTTRTFVDKRLAALYGIASPVTDGFGAVRLPSGMGRRGFLGQASFLTLQSHPIDTSAVLRGKFVRTALLCGEIQPPPANLNTGLPEVSENARTLRERSEIHQNNEGCASCHKAMDPIGLGFENFDAIGRWRDKENGVPIDAGGDLDGRRFSNAWELGAAVAEHPQLGYCLARNLYRYATGHVEEVGEVLFIDALAEKFRQSGYRVKALMSALATSPAFRYASEPVSEGVEE